MGLVAQCVRYAETRFIGVLFHRFCYYWEDDFWGSLYRGSTVLAVSVTHRKLT